MATGWREEDFLIAGKDYASRGRRFDEDIEFMQRAWRGEIVEGATKKLTPTPTNGESIPLVFGGAAPVAFHRAARYGVGFTAGGASPDEVSGMVQSARAAWTASGRTEAPSFTALTYFMLGAGGRDTAAYLADYNGDWGPNMAQQIPSDADALRGAVAACEAAGADELILDPVSSGMQQLEGLAEALDDRLAAQLDTAKPA